MLNNNKKLKLFINYLLIFVAFIILGAIVFLVNDNKGKKNDEVGEIIPINEQIKPDTLTNPFNFLKAKIGDVSSGLEIVKVNAYTGDGVPTLDNLQIQFTNKKLISGQINYYKDGLLQGKVCLENYNPYEQKSLPRVIGDSRLFFVCFNNTDEAIKKLTNVNPSESISIKIDNYTINLNNENAVNTADWVD